LLTNINVGEQGFIEVIWESDICYFIASVVW